MTERIKKFTKSEFLRGSFIVLVGNGVVNILGYLYHLVAGRFLAPADYGLLQSLFALTYFFAVFLNGASFSAINFISRVGRFEVFGVIKTLERKFLKLGVLLWILILSFWFLVKRLINFDDFSIYFIFSLFGFFSFLSVLYFAILRGRFKFLDFSILAIVQALLKLAFGWLFFLLGWKVLGAMGSLLGSAILVLVVGYFLVKKYWSGNVGGKERLVNFKSGFWKYSLVSLGVSLALTSIYSSDILLVRFIFSANESGIYGAVSILGKMIFFGATSILLVAFPFFTKYSEDLVKLKKSFWLSFLFLAVVCIMGIFVFGLWPSFVVGLVFSSGYEEVETVLFAFSIFISMLSVFNLFIQFLLAVKNKLSVLLSGLVAGFQIFLIISWHDSLLTIINNSIISLLIGLVLGGYLVFKEFRWLERQENRIY